MAGRTEVSSYLFCEISISVEDQNLKSKLDQSDKEEESFGDRKKRVYEKIRELRNKREEGVCCYYQNRLLINEARNMGVKTMFLLVLGSLCPSGTIVNLSGKITKRSSCMDKNALGMKEADVGKTKLEEKPAVKPR
ncbi:unnamed protein product [Lactuca saligna]|uniref:Uncharacterized protein n=1 Tax=Lactuca saligna TaxID=75948 RepID=A0AA36EGT6_LACSI|nr:unnamed protein product [Lactuca saligna]